MYAFLVPEIAYLFVSFSVFSLHFLEFFFYLQLVLHCDNNNSNIVLSVLQCSFIYFIHTQRHTNTHNHMAKWYAYFGFNCHRCALCLCVCVCTRLNRKNCILYSWNWLNGGMIWQIPCDLFGCVCVCKNLREYEYEREWNQLCYRCRWHCVVDHCMFLLWLAIKTNDESLTINFALTDRVQTMMMRKKENNVE